MAKGGSPCFRLATRYCRVERENFLVAVFSRRFFLPKAQSIKYLNWDARAIQGVTGNRTCRVLAGYMSDNSTTQPPT
jgi:hypothetical protein